MFGLDLGIAGVLWLRYWERHYQLFTSGKIKQSGLLYANLKMESWDPGNLEKDWAPGSLVAITLLVRSAGIDLVERGALILRC
jgi:hypothetical protein